MSIRRTASPRSADSGNGRAALCCALLLGLAVNAHAEDKGPLKPLDVFDLEWVADPEVSPDGHNIAYVRMRFDIKSDRRRGNIWITTADGKHQRPLSSAASSGSPRWSPDGTRIAYVARDAEGGNQLFLYWVDSGVTAPVSNLLDAPGSIAWSPDGKWLAFTMATPGEHHPLKVELPEAPKNAHWADPPKIIDRVVYRFDGEGYLPNAYAQLYLVSAEGGAARLLTHGDFDVDHPAFSADGMSILFSSNRRSDAEYEPTDSEIYRVSLDGEDLKALTDRRGPDRSPVASPDGKHIAYLGYDERYLGYQVAQLYVMDADGKNPRSLTASLDRDAEDPHFSADGKQIFFMYVDHGDSKIAAVDLNGKIRVLAENVGGTDMARPYSGGAYSVANNGRFAYTRSSPQAPPQLGTGTGKNDLATLTHFSDTLLSQRTLGKVEEIDFDSSADKRRIQGWVVTPPGFDAHKKYPMILEIHGGPFASYEPAFAAEMQLYAASGYVVLYMNPRGSTSYGADFGNLIHHDYPDKDYDDLMSGVDALIARGSIDTTRLFVTGGSGGGVLTAWIVGHTDRFRAAVVVKPVINWTSFVLTGDVTNFFYRYWFEGFPWDHQESYWRRSPLAYAGNVKTPTMVMTGEADMRTPSGEAEQFYEALKLRKVDTAMVRVPNASHEIAARPSLLNANVLYVMGWFKAHDVKGN